MQVSSTYGAEITVKVLYYILIFKKNYIVCVLKLSFYINY
jgi:hypothetical protein